MNTVDQLIHNVLQGYDPARVIESVCMEKLSPMQLKDKGIDLILKYNGQRLSKQIAQTLSKQLIKLAGLSNRSEKTVTDFLLSCAGDTIDFELAQDRAGNFAAIIPVLETTRSSDIAQYPKPLVYIRSRKPSHRDFTDQFYKEFIRKYGRNNNLNKSENLNETTPWKPIPYNDIQSAVKRTTQRLRNFKRVKQSTTYALFTSLFGPSMEFELRNNQVFMRQLKAGDQPSQ